MPNRKALWRTDFDAWVRLRIIKGDGCWLWTGAVDRRDYPRVVHDGKVINIVRYVLGRKLGRPVRDGFFACHHCDRPRCLREDHLYEGTPKQNIADCIARGRFQPKGNGLSIHPERAARGERHGTATHPEVYRGERASHAKLTEQQVREIRHRLKWGRTQDFLALEYGVTRAAIGSIAQGRTWAHVK
jgi:hypothetical protein